MDLDEQIRFKEDEIKSLEDSNKLLAHELISLD